MNKHRRYRTVLLVGVVCLLIVGAGGLWLHSERQQRSKRQQKSLDRQHSLNWQLLETVWEGPTEQAIMLVNEGADPNTLYEPGPSASLQDLSTLSVPPEVWPHDNPVSAFMMVCGTECPIGDNGTRSFGRDCPQLVEVMLKHGAQVNTKYGRGWTMLMASASKQYEKTVDILLKYGADVNAQDGIGSTALLCAIANAYDADGPDSNTYVIKQLLAHGANPNLPGKDGVTPLKLAKQNNRPDLVTLLRKYGAKK